MKYRIQEFDPEWNWQTIDEADTLEDALLIASAQCPFDNKEGGNNIRILTPEGDVV